MALNFQGNQYKKIGDKNIKNFCSTVYMDNHQELFEDYQSHTSNPVPWKTCPYPKGSNEVKNFLLKNSASLLPPYIPGGEKWKIEVRFFRGEAELGGYNIYGLLRSNASLLGWTKERNITILHVQYIVESWIKLILITTWVICTNLKLCSFKHNQDFASSLRSRIDFSSTL